MPRCRRCRACVSEPRSLWPRWWCGSCHSLKNVRKISHLSLCTCCSGRRGPLMESLSPRRQPAPTGRLSPLICSVSLPSDACEFHSRRLATLPFGSFTSNDLVRFFWHSAALSPALLADYGERLQLLCF